MGKDILELNNIFYSYHSLQGETEVLRNLSFHVKEGEFLAIVGPSGCGKSTLLSLIAGLLLPKKGTITFFGTTMGYMLQKDHLFDWLSIYDNITLGCKINHLKESSYQENIKELLNSFELTDFAAKRPCELSGGMRQRAALIRTLALNPQLILLDEPFSALDYQTRLSVSLDICRTIRKAEKSAILITHDLSEALRLGDRILVLSKRPSQICLEVEVPKYKKTTDQDSSDEILDITTDSRYHELFQMLWKALGK